jgi:hypothetical protein
MMKKALIPAVLATLALGAVAAPSYAAVGQPRGNAYGHNNWQAINARQANLDRRIDQGVRNGALTRQEAINLRAEFSRIAVLEATYRRSGGGLDARERADLDRRFDALSARVRIERNDRDNRGGGAWQNINQRQAQLDRRIDQGVRNGTLSRREAVRLRAEFRQIAVLEAQYRRSGRGLDNRERADLDRRFDRLSMQIRMERRDRDDRRGYGDRDDRRDGGRRY